METLATSLLGLIGGYLLLGLLFAIAFAFRGASRIDPAARQGTVGFRLVIIPGAAALWPLLARRWLRRQGPPDERGPHRLAAQAPVPKPRRMPGENR